MKEKSRLKKVKNSKFCHSCRKYVENALRIAIKSESEKLRKEKIIMEVETIRKAKYYNEKCIWKITEMREAENFRRTIKFETEADLNFEVMNFFYDGMLAKILEDAKDQAERFGFGIGYEWGKRYLNHYVGHYCLVSDEKYSALRSSQTYDLMLEELISTLE